MGKKEIESPKQNKAVYKSFAHRHKMIISSSDKTSMQGNLHKEWNGECSK